jgi:hypothetical protein
MQCFLDILYNIFVTLSGESQAQNLVSKETGTGTTYAVVTEAEFTFLTSTDIS